jgi:hypothetical protein
MVAVERTNLIGVQQQIQRSMNLPRAAAKMKLPVGFVKWKEEGVAAWFEFQKKLHRVTLAIPCRSILEPHSQTKWMKNQPVRGQSQVFYSSLNSFCLSGSTFNPQSPRPGKILPHGPTCVNTQD